jgi:hypothetical protein
VETIANSDATLPDSEASVIDPGVILKLSDSASKRSLDLDYAFLIVATQRVFYVEQVETLMIWAEDRGVGCQSAPPHIAREVALPV